MDEVKSTEAYNPRKAAEEGAWLTLREPDGTDAPIRLHLMGHDCDAYTDKFREIQRRNARELERARKFKLATPEQQEADQLDLAVAATKGWDNGGKPFSGQAVRQLYVDRPDYREQADAFVNDRANFFKKAARS